MALRYEDVADLIKIIDASACEELVLETSELKLVVRRRGANAPAFHAPDPVAAPEAPAPTPAPTPARGAMPAPSAEQIEVRAPMVGTFYRAPAPGAQPFVEVGSVVEVGQPIGIIEVMKLFTTLYAEQAGRVVRIDAEDGDAVERGQTLLLLDRI